MNKLLLVVSLLCSIFINHSSACLPGTKKKLLLEDLNILEMLENEVKIHLDSLNLKEKFKVEPAPPCPCPFFGGHIPVQIIAPPPSIYSPPPSGCPSIPPLPYHQIALPPPIQPVYQHPLPPPVYQHPMHPHMNYPQKYDYVKKW